MSQWPDLAALELLVAVAEHGSLAAGARAVEMAQPNASRSLARLERFVGVPLLQRSTRGSRLTPAGLLVTDWARSVVTGARRLVDGAALLGQNAPGTLSLRVSASQTVAEHLLPRWLAGLRSAFPESRVQVTVHNSHDVVQDILHGAADVGFVECPKPPSGVHRAVVARDELVLVVHPQHPWASRQDPVSTAELADTPLITREAGSGTRMALEGALGRPVKSLLEMPSNAAVRVSVQAGSAPAVLSRLAVDNALAAGTLVQVPIALNLRRELHAVWHGPRRMQGLPAELVAEARRTGNGSVPGGSA